jgi:hypothetical protein
MLQESRLSPVNTGERVNQLWALTRTSSSLADVVFNHMTAQDSGTGVAGSPFTQFSYPGTYTPQNFHYCGLEPNNIIVNYSNRLEVQTCELDGLAE